MIKSKRRINKRELIEGSRTDRAPSYWENQPWFKTLRSKYGLSMALKMGFDARRDESWIGDSGFGSTVSSVVVWYNTSYFELWMNA